MKGAAIFIILVATTVCAAMNMKASGTHHRVYGDAEEKRQDDVCEQKCLTIYKGKGACRKQCSDTERLASSYDQATDCSSDGCQCCLPDLDIIPMVGRRRRSPMQLAKTMVDARLSQLRNSSDSSSDENSSEDSPSEDSSSEDSTSEDSSYDSSSSDENSESSSVERRRRSPMQLVKTIVDTLPSELRDSSDNDSSDENSESSSVERRHRSPKQLVKTMVDTLQSELRDSSDNDSSDENSESSSVEG